MVALYAFNDQEFNIMIIDKSIRPVFYLGAATVGFFGGFIKGMSGNHKTMVPIESAVAIGIATQAVRQTTRPFSYFGHEDSRLWNSMAQISRGSGIFAATAAATVAGSVVGESVGRHVRFG